MARPSPTRISKGPGSKCFRHWFKTLFTWDLCAKAACKHARACRGHSRRSLDAAYPEMPPAARAWFKEILALQASGLKFDCAIDPVDLPAADAARFEQIDSESGGTRSESRLSLPRRGRVAPNERSE